MMKDKYRIPADVDPVELADKIKGNLTSEWLKRRAKLRARQDKQSV